LISDFRRRAESSIVLTKKPEHALSATSFFQWVWNANLILDGKPLTFCDHEYLIEPYMDDHPWQVEEKATQLGLTSRVMIWVFYLGRFTPIRGIIYYFPSKTDMTAHVLSRFDPLIDENPQEIGQYMQKTDSTVVKQFANTFLYFRGMQSRVGMKSTPADVIVYDELDEAPQSSIAMIQKRMSHSAFKLVRMLSNPTLPDYGINFQFLQTDQKYWLLKCEKCNGYTCMEDTFPECLHEKNDGSVIRICTHCRDHELHPSIGEWVAKKPRITEKSGRHYTQLWSTYEDPKEILNDFLTTRFLEHFYNLTIGIAWVAAENRLSIEQVLSCCGDHGMADSDRGPCFMGVDQKGDRLHVVIGKRIGRSVNKIVYIGEHEDFEELDELMPKFRVARGVIDALPEKRAAKALAKRHKGKLFCCFYSHHQKGSYTWNNQEHHVMANRTESLDASHRMVIEGELLLPKESDIVRTFAIHCNNTAKKIKDDDEEKKASKGVMNRYPTGDKTYVYVKLEGPDHFRHAYNYQAMAATFIDEAFFRGAV